MRARSPSRQPCSIGAGGSPVGSAVAAAIASGTISRMPPALPFDTSWSCAGPPPAGPPSIASSAAAPPMPAALPDGASRSRQTRSAVAGVQLAERRWPREPAGVSAGAAPGAGEADAFLRVAGEAVPRPAAPPSSSNSPDERSSVS